jgi:hypothetical protein
MRQGQAEQRGFTRRGQADDHLSGVVLVRHSRDQTHSLQAIDQSDRAVVADEQTLRELPDRGSVRRRCTDGQKRLVLLGLQPSGPGRILTEVKETADLIADFR